MRTTFIISFVGNLIFIVGVWIFGPSRVAMHFGPGGEPGNWAPACVNALIMSGVLLLLFVPIFFAPRLIRIAPRWLNGPNKDYWLREENRDRMEAMLTARMYRFGTVTFVFIFLVGLLALQANLSTPVRFREDLFWWPFGVYMAYMAYWTVEIMLAFRVRRRQ